MESIIDIYIKSKCDRYNGRILLYDNNLFEGIAKSPITEENYLLLGYLSDKEIKITRYNSIGNIDEFNLQKSSKKYRYGTEETIQVTLLPAELIRESSEFELVYVKSRIEEIKRRKTI